MDASEHTQGAGSAHYAGVFCRLVESYGWRREQVLAGTRLTRAQLEDPTQRLTSADFRRLLTRGFQLTQDPALGLRMGQLLDIRQQGFMGYGALSSATLGDALAVHKRFHGINHNLVDVSSRLEQDRVVIQFDERGPSDALLPLTIDTLLVSFCTMGRELVGDIEQLEARVSYPQRPHHKLLRAWFPKLSVMFDTAANQLRFPVRELNRACLHADPQLQRLVIRQCEVQQQELRSELSVIGRVRRCVTDRLREGAPFQSVARDMGMSVRTLRRRLVEAGTTYHALREQVRRGSAIECVAASSLTVGEIAERVGYSDPANFLRAFRRWTGLSPGRYRLRVAERRAQAAADD